MGIKEFLGAKKRYGRRVKFGVSAGILVTTALYVILFTVDDLSIGLKFFVAYAAVIGLLAGVISGFLTKTDVKELLLKRKFDEKEDE